VSSTTSAAPARARPASRCSRRPTAGASSTGAGQGQEVEAEPAGQRRIVRLRPQSAR
jgi:hypothetical protein